MRKRRVSEAEEGTECTIEHVTLRRLVREGTCPIVEVSAVYPVVTVGGDEGVWERFNRAYREAAEAFVAWAVEHPVVDAGVEFAALGVGATYRYDRRCLACRFEANLDGAGEGEAADARHVVVTRTVTDGRRRAGILSTYVERWLWRLSDGMVCGREAVVLWA